MKTKNIASGLMVISFFIVFKLVVILIATSPSGSRQQSQLCQFDSVSCSVPEHLGVYHMFPR